jgi:hypothetical protein
MATCCGEAQLIHIGCNGGLVGDTHIVYTRYSVSRYTIYGQIYSIVLSIEAFAVSSVIRYIRTDVCILYCLCAPHG